MDMLTQGLQDAQEAVEEYQDATEEAADEQEAVESQAEEFAPGDWDPEGFSLDDEEEEEDGGACFEHQKWDIWSYSHFEQTRRCLVISDDTRFMNVIDVTGWEGAEKFRDSVPVAGVDGVLFVMCQHIKTMNPDRLQAFQRTLDPEDIQAVKATLIRRLIS